MQNDIVSYWSRGKLEFVPACPACGKEGHAKAIFSRRDNESAMPVQWHMVYCEST